MSTSINFAPEVHVFACPKCGETINTSMQVCSFCGTPIDHGAAERAAAETSRVSAACSDASFLTVMAASLVPAFALMFAPLLGFIGGVAFFFLRVAIPFMCIRWWIKYGKIKTTDPDFSNARGRAIWVSVVGALVFLWLCGGFVMGILKARAHP